MKKFTAIYTQSYGNYGGSYPYMIRFEQKEGETVIGALDRAGYEKGLEYDISPSLVYLFIGDPKLQGVDDEIMPSLEINGKSRIVEQAITGASAGALIGSIGGLVGAIAGAIVGALVNSIIKEASKEEEEEEEE